MSKGRQFNLHHNGDYLDKVFPNQKLMINWYYEKEIFAIFPFTKYPILITPMEGLWECDISFKGADFAFPTARIYFYFDDRSEILTIYGIVSGAQA